MLAHSFDRFYVVTNFILPSIKDLKFLRLKYDNICAYLVASLVMQQIKGVGTVTQEEINAECKILTYYKFGFNSFWPSDGWNSTL